MTKTIRIDQSAEAGNTYSNHTTSKETSGNAPTIFDYRASCRSAAEKTPWPRLGAVKLAELKANPIFGTEPFARAFQAGDTAIVYMCGCSALLGHARRYKLPLFKIGASRLPSLLTRQRDLCSDRYASAHLDEDGRVVDEPGWDDWEMRRIDLLAAPHAASPVRVVPRGLSVTMPRDLDFRVFEKQLHHRMSRSSLSSFASSRSGQKHFAHLGIDSSTVPRMTSYGFGSEQRLSRSDELYLARPREDASRLVVIIESIVVDSLKLSTSSTPPRA